MYKFNNIQELLNENFRLKKEVDASRVLLDARSLKINSLIHENNELIKKLDSRKSPYDHECSQFCNCIKYYEDVITPIIKEETMQHQHSKKLVPKQFASAENIKDDADMVNYSGEETSLVQGSNISYEGLQSYDNVFLKEIKDTLLEKKTDDESSVKSVSSETENVD